MGLKRPITGVVVALTLALAGCATPVEPAMMTPKVASGVCARANPALAQAIAIDRVAGGKETNPANVPEVGNDGLREALTRTLARCGLLSPDPDTAPYRLKATLVELNRPIAGFTMTVDAFMRYELVRARDGAVLFDEIINGAATKTLEDAFDGRARLKLASGGAVQATIAKLLERLNALALPEEPA